MPNRIVIELAHKTGKSIFCVETVWRRAKRLAANEGQKANYLLITEMTKRMLGITTTMKRVKIGQRVSWKTITGDVLHGTVEGTLPDCCMIRVTNPKAAPSMEDLLARKNGLMVVPLLDVNLL